MSKFLLIVLLVAVIVAIGVLVARSRANSADALPPDDRPDAVEPPPADETAIAAPPSDITTSAAGSSPLPPEPVPEWVEQASPPSALDVQPETEPPMEPEPADEPLPEPDPVVEPEPPMQPEPIIEPDAQPAEPEPVIEPDAQPAGPEPAIEPDTAGVGSPLVDHPAADPDEPTDPPQAVIDAGELPAVDLDPDAGWENDDDQTIHADPESGLYHTPDSPGYKLGPDGEVFESEEEAERAGFTRWDRPDEPS
jgi:outer membrane biosynthesis protein TonB